MDKIKIVLVDDHEIVRDGVKALLSLNKKVDIIGEASCSDDFFELLKSNTPNIVILDIEMPGISGLEIAKILEERHPEIRKILLSANIDEANISKAIENGVLGILPKNCSHNDLSSAIDKACAGEAYYNKFVTDILIKNYIKRNTLGKKYEQNLAIELSEREIEVIRCFADGLIYKEIAEKLCISPRTVESHKVNILQKLNLNTIIDLVKYAIKNDIVKL